MLTDCLILFDLKRHCWAKQLISAHVFEGLLGKRVLVSAGTRHSSRLKLFQTVFLLVTIATSVVRLKRTSRESEDWTDVTEFR
jgi:hypothetical protein